MLHHSPFSQPDSRPLFPLQEMQVKEIKWGGGFS